MSRRLRAAGAALTLMLAAAAFLLILPGTAMAAPPPYTINATNGGDCSLIGSWDGPTLTCTLNQDVSVSGTDAILLSDNGLTLDGAGHSVSGNNTNGTHGVYVNSNNNITIRNATVSGFEWAVFVFSSTGDTVSGVNATGNTANNSGNGIYLQSSSSVTISYNNSSNNDYGIWLQGCASITVDGNIFNANVYNGIIDVNNTGGNTLTHNIISSTSYGASVAIDIGSTNNDLITFNSVLDNAQHGISLYSSSSNTLNGNVISGNPGVGLSISNASNNNSIYHNDFVNNGTQASVATSTGNTFDITGGGGNYWSNFSTPAQGCHDTNLDGICDSSYIFTGGSDTGPWVLPYGWTSYYWTWYDNANGADWLLLANPTGLTEWASGSIANIVPVGYLLAPIPAGSTITPQFGSLTNGPVVVDPFGPPLINSQRILWPQGGSSLEEVPGTNAGKLSNIFYWTWYDMQSAGFQDWVMVSNPNGYQVYCEISVAGNVVFSGNVAAGANVTPTFPGTIGGPVMVQAWTDSGKSEPSRVMASQRVLTNNGSAFNELPGTPAGDLASDYLWTWYDSQSAGAQDWVVIANPPGAAAPIYYTIRIAGTEVVTAGGPVPAGGSATPTFPGTMGGPVEVTTFTDPAHPGISAASSLCSQRSLWGPSFEEVPGQGASSLNFLYEWTWYDQVSAGMSNWVLVANPGGSSIYYEVSVGGTVQDSGTIAGGAEIEHSYSGLIGGPVEVNTWTDGSKTVRANSLSSQRVLYNNYFNEVWGETYTWG